MDKATFGAGCFWGVEEAFRTLPGVSSTAVGYMGGSKTNPTYQDVCSHTTGHAEVVQVEFDPQTVSFEELLNKFFSIHNPTTLNRQGPDVGDQYRSAVFFHSPEQQAAAAETVKQLTAAGKFRDPIVTQIVPAAEFWKAEEYHQQYLKKQGRTHCSY
ncbi:MAG: peptide-methionine (S)-S-oxide reductase MsrA [Candidatus Obscuribacterales bacterium]